MHAISVAHKGETEGTPTTLSIIFNLYVHYTDSLPKHVGWARIGCRREAVGTSERRARSTDGGRDRPVGQSLLQPQRRRRVGLDED